MTSLKKILKKTSFYTLRDFALKQINAKKVIKNWELNGRIAPSPQQFKHKVIKGYAKPNRIRIFIETGTFHGETIDACKSLFKKLYSIELSQELFKMATIKFKDTKKVTILQGDSGEVLGGVIKGIDERCLFWLDGHYSEGNTAKGSLNTPILKELTSILNHPVKNHIILIDDARCFNGTDDYPTLEYLKSFIKESKEPSSL